ncbi:nitroreductase family deazaflavin-dependent oxidoreductase [Mycobacterium sp. 1164966.3]|uniref:nitroreductase family deazaflavin-dependent oxidoreductase n=1 Tax=Mycobacterium sp. 1164966.3 TaxID=1856861 RepID=UPI00156138EE|nr:nitroreductase family deazaflavin-dependent oxidoreductase [Mycobacterium sp. 1164966.3]
MSLIRVAPWWVVLETVGRHSGKPRQVPLARGPQDGDCMWLISVHGTHSDFVRNIAAERRVRLRIRGQWMPGTASIEPMDSEILSRFNWYARQGPKRFGIDPKLLRVQLARH